MKRFSIRAVVLSVAMFTTLITTIGIGVSTASAAPGAATHFTVSVASPQTAGTAFNFTVIALDSTDAVATGYPGTVHFTTTDTATGVSLPADYTFVAGDGGVHIFSATLVSPGPQTITATDTTTSSITGTSSSVVVNAAPNPTHFTVSVASPQTAGIPFSITVQALNATNTVITGYQGTVSFATSDSHSGVVVPSSYTFVASDDGSHTFTDNTTLVTAGSQTITATDTTNSSITGTSPVTVDPASAMRFSFGAISPQTAGTPFGFTATALDSFGNIATGYRGTMHFTTTDTGSGVSLPADYTFVAGDGGIHTFSGATLVTAGSRTITATDTNNSSVTGTSSSITVVAPTSSLSGPPSPVQASTSGTTVNLSFVAVGAGNTALDLPTNSTFSSLVVRCGDGNEPTLSCQVGAIAVTMGDSSVTVPVTITQSNTAYFSPQPLTISVQDTSDPSVPQATFTAAALIESDYQPTPDVDVVLSPPSTLTLSPGTASGTVQFNAQLINSTNHQPVTAGEPVTVNVSVACPETGLSVSVLSCSNSNQVTIPVGSDSATVAVTVTDSQPDAFFSPQQLTLTALSATTISGGPNGTIGVVSPTSATAIVNTTVAEPSVTITGPSTIVLPEQQGLTDYQVSFSGPTASPVTLALNVTSGGLATLAQEGVDYGEGVDPVGVDNGNLAPTVTCPPIGGNRVLSGCTVMVNFLAPTIHEPIRGFDLNITSMTIAGSSPVVTSGVSALTSITDTFGGGILLAGTDGGVFAEGTAHFYGSAVPAHPVAPIAAIASTPDDGGYWLLGVDGGVFSFGDAAFYGSMAGKPHNGHFVGIAADPNGDGYWLVASDGGVFFFGKPDTSGFFGSAAPFNLNAPIIGIVATHTGRGYYLEGADGGIFAFGDAKFEGSLPSLCGSCTSSRSLLGMALDTNGTGYWLVGEDGGVYAFGTAPYAGNFLNTGQSFVGVTADSSGEGYSVVARNGAVFGLGTGATSSPPVAGGIVKNIENIAGQ